MRRDGLFTTSLANAFCLRLHARKTWISARQVWQEAARDGFAASIGAERNSPALAAYMGHVGMNGMERYLSLTAAHYRRQVTELSAPLTKKRTH